MLFAVLTWCVCVCGCGVSILVSFLIFFSSVALFFSTLLSLSTKGDEFPNGRWGDSSSAAFGELSDSHFFGFQGLKNPEDRKAEWDEAPIEDKDVWEVFARYVEGKCSRQVF